jgi:hypothetical protein
VQAVKRKGFASLVAFGMTATLLAQGPAAQPPPGGQKPLWTITMGLAAPESAYYHEPSNSIFVSNINGQVLDKDGNGYITRIAPSGRVLAEKWATGLNAPKGLRSIGNTIWTADIDEVVGMDVAQDGRVSARVRVEGAQFLNDLATAPDGTIYVSDSNQSRIYMVKDGKSSVFVEGAELVEQPNGVLVDGDRLILGSIGPAAAPGAGRGRGGAAAGGKLMAFDLKTRQRTLLTTETVGGIDGIESAEAGGLLITDVIGRRLLHVYRTGTVVPLLTFEQGGADFGYVPVTVTRPSAIAPGPVAVVPFLFGNSVSAYVLDGSVGR